MAYAELIDILGLKIEKQNGFAIAQETGRLRARALISEMQNNGVFPAVYKDGQLITLISKQFEENNDV